MYNVICMSMIFVDIDGTLIDTVHNLLRPSEKTKMAFEKLRLNGHRVFIASGRALVLIDHTILELKPSGLITCNGAKAYYDDKTISEVSFSFEELAILNQVKKETNSVLYLESDEKIYCSDLNDPLHQTFVEYWRLNCSYLPFEDQPRSDIHIAMMFFTSKDLAQQAKQVLEANFDIRFHASGLSFDVNIKGVSKASPIQKLRELYPNEQTLAIGDGENDLEMLEATDFAIAMGNACESLKARADFITSAVLDEGFYEAMVKVGLF